MSGYKFATSYQTLIATLKILVPKLTEAMYFEMSNILIFIPRFN